MIKLIDCSDINAEYWAHVSAQDELPIAASEAIPGKTESPTIVVALESLANGYDPTNPDKTEAYLAPKILENPDLINQLRLLISVSDKRLYLDLSYIFSRSVHPANPERTLCGCLPHNLVRHATPYFINLVSRKKQDPEGAMAAATLISEYLLKRGLFDILRVFSRLSATDRKTVVDTLISPKEAQQNDAKRRGHGPEAALAGLLRALEVRFKPEDKDTKPMGSHDPNIDKTTFELAARDSARTFSSDIVILDANDCVTICVVGLVHSSDPGQFGVDKSNTVIDIRTAMDVFNKTSRRAPVEIWGLVDGVGYSENKAGTIHKMLPYFSCFVQMKTLYKAALRLHQLGFVNLKAIRFDTGFYTEKTMGQMVDSYVPKGVKIIYADNEVKGTWRPVPAGLATIYL